MRPWDQSRQQGRQFLGDPNSGKPPANFNKNPWMLWGDGWDLSTKFGFWNDQKGPEAKHREHSRGREQRSQGLWACPFYYELVALNSLVGNWKTKLQLIKVQKIITHNKNAILLDKAGGCWMGKRRIQYNCEIRLVAVVPHRPSNKGEAGGGIIKWTRSWTYKASLRLGQWRSLWGSNRGASIAGWKLFPNPLIGLGSALAFENFWKGSLRGKALQISVQIFQNFRNFQISRFVRGPTRPRRETLNEARPLKTISNLMLAWTKGLCISEYRIQPCVLLDHEQNRELVSALRLP